MIFVHYQEGPVNELWNVSEKEHHSRNPKAFQSTEFPPPCTPTDGNIEHESGVD